MRVCVSTKDPGALEGCLMAEYEHTSSERALNEHIISQSNVPVRTKH